MRDSPLEPSFYTALQWAWPKSMPQLIIYWLGILIYGGTIERERRFEWEAARYWH